MFNSVSPVSAAWVISADEQFARWGVTTGIVVLVGATLWSTDAVSERDREGGRERGVRGGGRELKWDVFQSRHVQNQTSSENPPELLKTKNQWEQHYKQAAVFYSSSVRTWKLHRSILLYHSNNRSAHHGECVRGSGQNPLLSFSSLFCFSWVRTLEHLVAIELFCSGVDGDRTLLKWFCVCWMCTEASDPTVNPPWRHTASLALWLLSPSVSSDHVWTRWWRWWYRLDPMLKHILLQWDHQLQHERRAALKKSWN